VAPANATTRARPAAGAFRPTRKPDQPAAGGSGTGPERRLRVLLVTPDFPPAKGGIQTLMGELARHLPAAAAVDVRIVTFDHPEAPAFDAQAVLTVRRARLGARVPRARIAALSAAAMLEARTYGADVVLLGHVAAFPAGLATRRLLGIPSVLYVHAEEFRVWPRRCRTAIAGASAVIAVSRHSEAMALAAGAPAQAVHRIPNAVTRPPAPPLPLGPADAAAPPTVLTVARMTQPHKGHDVMVRAIALLRRHVPDARWVVVGDGPLRARYEHDAAQLGIADGVIFTGAVSDKRRDDWFARADVFAMPSRPSAGAVGGEGFGIVYLEAAAHGLPVVAANEGGALDAVDDGRTGVLVDPRDPEAVAAALAGLLSDRERARAMGRAGYEWAGQFSWDATAARVAEVLRISASRRARSS
jgi:phosphatidylinositol alpha-1,6-mannosyltransferase